MGKVDNLVEFEKANYKKKSQLISIWHRFKKNRRAVFGLTIIILMTFVAIFAKWVSPYDPIEQNLLESLSVPSAKHLLGTDEFGRDILSRIIYGSRISLSVGVGAIVIACILGGMLGAVAGYYGGRIGNLIMRAMDILLAIPSILLSIAIVAALGASVQNLMFVIGITNIPRYVRTMESAILSVRNQEYIEASKATGASDFYIIMTHIIPNCMSPLIVQVTLSIGSAILTCASLSFIGLGVNPPTPEWGAMLSNGQEFLRSYPHITLFPGLAIMLSVFSFNLMGDGLRDALDPKLKN